MSRQMIIGCTSLVFCLVCIFLAFLVGPFKPGPAPVLFFLAGAFYGLAMAMAMKYANAGPSNAQFSHNQQREIDTTYEQLKIKIQGMRK